MGTPKATRLSGRVVVLLGLSIVELRNVLAQHNISVFLFFKNYPALSCPKLSYVYKKYMEKVITTVGL